MVNPRPAGHVARACVADVARGLRSRVFDLVVGNPPWLPPRATSSDENPTFAVGGPTGFEIPTRFLREGSSLLAPGGTLIVLAVDAALPDGSRPLREACRALQQEGYQVSLLPTDLTSRWAHLIRDAFAALGPRADPKHVVVFAHRPD
jgi:methylase of polypeptide subunit release factors